MHVKATNKNICIFTQTLLPGGAERQAMLLELSLREIYTTTLLIYYKNKISEEHKKIIKENNISLYELSGNHFQKMAQLYKILKRKKIDILFSYLLLPSFLGGIVGKLAGVKFTFGGIRSSKLDKNKIWINKILQNYINNQTVYNNSSGYYNLSKRGFNPKRAVVIPNCFDVKNDPIIRNKKESVTILTVGRFHLSKDYKTAIEAIHYLYEEIVNIKFIIIGWGELENDIRNWIKLFGIEKITSVVINPKNLSEHYQKADIYMQSSIFEGLSNTIMEAMSYSLPIVTTDVGDNRELVAEGENGYICKVKDSLSIANGLKILVNNEKLRNHYGLQGYNILKSKYSIKKFTDNYMDLIRKYE